MALGSARRLKSGRWQARYRIPAGTEYPPGLPRDVKAPFTFDTRMAADAWLIAEARAIRDGLWEHPAVRADKRETATITVGEWMRRWLDGKRAEVDGGHLRQSTYQTYAAIVTNRILNIDGAAAKLRAIPVVSLTPPDVARWWDAINRQYPATAQRNWQALGKLREAMGHAVEHGLVDFSPVTVKARKPRPKRKRLPEDWELYTLLDAMPEQYRAATCLMLFHGMRIGEVLNLRRANIQITPVTPPLLPEVHVQVQGNVQRLQIDGKTTMVAQDPKTDAGFRRVPVFAEFVPLILRARAHAGTAEDALLTTTATGKCVMDTSFRSVFNRARDAAGLPDDLHPHVGRDWLTTRLAENGASPKEIGAITGQEDVSTVLNTYMQVRAQRPEDMMRRVAGTLDALRAGRNATNGR